MNTLLKILVLITATLFASASMADLQRGIKNYQAIMNGSKKIEQLNQNELQEVLSVHESMKRRSGSSTGTSRPSYEIEVSHNDELFIINGEKFEARTYCFNMDEGDRVIFIEGSALGACVSATVINLRTKDKCELWCE